MTFLFHRSLSLCFLALVGGCGDGLFYGENTSFDFAAIRVNADPAQPIKVNVGLNRNVLTVAPPLNPSSTTQDANGDQNNPPSGESVSQFSTFTVNAGTPFVTPGQFDTFIQSRFASGAAAVAVAGDPSVAGAIMGFTPFTRLGPNDKEPLRHLSDCVNKMQIDQLNTAAGKLNITLSDSARANEPEARLEINDHFLSSESNDLRKYADTLKDECPK